MWFRRTSRIAGQQIACIFENSTWQCIWSSLKNKRNLYVWRVIWVHKSFFKTRNRIKHHLVKKNLHLHQEKYSRRKSTLGFRWPIVLTTTQLIWKGKKLQRQDSYDRFRFIQNNTDDQPDENEELAEEYASLTVSSFKVEVFVFVVLKVKSFPVDVFDMKSNNVWSGELIYLKVLSSKFMKHQKVARNKILDKNPPKKW